MSDAGAANFNNAVRFTEGFVGEYGSATILGLTAPLQVTGNSAAETQVHVLRRSADANSGTIVIAKSRSTQSDSFTAVNDNDYLGQYAFVGDNGTNMAYISASITAQASETYDNNGVGADLIFNTTANNATTTTERMRITQSGDVTTTGAAFARANPGFTARNGDSVSMSRDAGTTLEINRSDDGQIVNFRSATVSEGGISISGTTVSYNSFSGSHWSRLADNSQPTILKGTLIENIDEMCDWYLVTFTVPDLMGLDEGNNPIVSEAEHVVTEEVGLPAGKSVGDEMEYTYSENNTTYTGTISKAGDNKHPKCKISDTADSTRIYGVFAAWDHDDANVNDMYVTAVGTHVVRVHGGQTVSAGDLLVSNGDGTAKVQDDDIIRSKTLGKVLTHIKQETYADNSYTVPCALYCG